MFKTIATLIRGHGADTAQANGEVNALTILRQQLRDAANGLDRSRRAVAVVMAYAERERKTAERIGAQLADLEQRAIAALRQGREDLADEAASAMAELEDERAANTRAIAQYETEIRRLREQVSLADITNAYTGGSQALKIPLRSCR